MADFDDVLDALKDEVADRGAAIATGSWRFVVHVHFRSVPTSLLAAPSRGFTLSPAVCIL